MYLELLPDELKLLIANLNKKKELNNNPEDIISIDNRINELSDILKKKNQDNINVVFKNIQQEVSTVTEQLEQLNNQNTLDLETLKSTELSDTDSSEDSESFSYVILSSNQISIELKEFTNLIEKIKNIGKWLTDIVDYQYEIQNTKDPENWFFDFLVFPIKKNVPTKIENTSPQSIVPDTNNKNTPTEQAETTSNLSIGKNIPANEIKHEIEQPVKYQGINTTNTNRNSVTLPQNLVFSSEPVDFESPEFQNKRQMVNYYAMSENYESIYQLLKQPDYKIDIRGLEDILGRPLPYDNRSTIYDQVMLLCPVTDDFELIDENNNSEPTGTEIHMSEKARQIFSENNIDIEASPSRGFLNKLKLFNQ